MCKPIQKEFRGIDSESIDTFNIIVIYFSHSLQSIFKNQRGENVIFLTGENLYNCSLTT